MQISHAHVDHVQLLDIGHAVQMVAPAKGVQDASVTMLAPSLVTVAMILKTSVQLVLVQ